MFMKEITNALLFRMPAAVGLVQNIIQIQFLDSAVSWEVKMEAAVVSIYSLIHKLMCHGNQRI